jgi:hypothetical protein
LWIVQLGKNDAPAASVVSPDSGSKDTSNPPLFGGSDNNTDSKSGEPESSAPTETEEKVDEVVDTTPASITRTPAEQKDFDDAGKNSVCL